MTLQTEFELTPPAEKHPWRTVRESSIAAYVEGRDYLDGREKAALLALAYYHNCHQQWPTAAEAYELKHTAQWKHSAEFKLGVLNMRRAISDLRQRGVVEPNGIRPCSVSGRKKIESWRIIPIGRSK